MIPNQKLNINKEGGILAEIIEQILPVTIFGQWHQPESLSLCLQLICQPSHVSVAAGSGMEAEMLVVGHLCFSQSAGIICHD